MNELIKVSYKGDRQTVSARDLWEFLDRPYTRFDLWFNKYKDYGFIENHDFRAYVIKTTHAKGRVLYLEDEEERSYVIDFTGKDGAVVHKGMTKEEGFEGLRMLFDLLLEKLDIDESELWELYG